MKNLLCILSLIVFFYGLSAFADYKPIPKELSKQYKAEIESIINQEYPKIIYQQKNIYDNAEKMYKNVFKDKSLYEDFCFNNFDTAINTPLFNLYLLLINSTKKYVSFSDNDIPATDSSILLSSFIYPYFKDNNVSNKKIKLIQMKENYYYKKIEKMYNKTHKFIYPQEKY